jgi:hypothetical protein
MLVFWVVTPCGLAGRFQSFGGNPKYGRSLFLRNVGIYLQVLYYPENQLQQTVLRFQLKFKLTAVVSNNTGLQILTLQKLFWF